MQPEIILTEIDVPGAKLTKDLAECNVDELKSWLDCRGQKKGRRKKELIARVEGLLKLNLPILLIKKLIMVCGTDKTNRKIVMLCRILLI